MKEILILAAALGTPAAPSAPILELEQGETAQCRAAEGCVIMTRRALGELFNEMGKQAEKTCRKENWI